MPPNTPGSRRAIPIWIRPGQTERLRDFLQQGEGWVLRPRWSGFLEGRDGALTPIAELTRDQRIAARAWLEQQRHALHRAIEGGEVAPEGWLEAFPLHRALRT